MISPLQNLHYSRQYISLMVIYLFMLDGSWEKILVKGDLENRELRNSPPPTILDLLEAHLYVDIHKVECHLLDRCGLTPYACAYIVLSLTRQGAYRLCQPFLIQDWVSSSLQAFFSFLSLASACLFQLSIGIMNHPKT